MKQMRDNGITYDTLLHRIPSDTDTVSFYRVVAVGKDYHSYFTVNHGMVTKVYVTERGDTFYYYDYSPTIESLTFNVKLHNAQRSMDAHDTIIPGTIAPIGDTRLTSEFIELPQPVTVNVKHDHSVECTGGLIFLSILATSMYIVRSAACWNEFAVKFRTILTA
jgi:hypothetical protein